MYQKAIIPVLALIVLAMGGLFLSGYLPSKTSDKEKLNKPLGNTVSTDKVVFLKKEDSNTEIIQSNLAGENKVLFNDKDDSDKISLTSNIASVSKEIAIITSGQNKNQLSIAKLDGSGEKQLVSEHFDLPKALTLSYNGKKIAYAGVVYEKENEEVGIFEVDRSGQNLRQIASEKDEIISLSYNFDASKIVYLSKNKNKSMVTTIDLNNMKADEVYSTDKQIFSIAWPNNIVFSESLSKELKTGKIVAVENGSSEKIMEFDQCFPGSPYLVSNRDIYYNSATYEKDFDKDRIGDISYINKLTNKTSKLGNGQLILGLLP